MAPIPAPNIIHLAAIFSLAGERIENTFHYHVTATINRALLSAIAQSYLDWFAAHTGLFSNQLALELLYVRDLSVVAGQTLDFVPLTTQHGTNSNRLFPNSVTLAIKRESGLAGRKNRGRIYWPGITVDICDSDNTIAPSEGALRADRLNTLLAAQLSANAATEVILHRALGTGTNVLGYTVTDFNLDNQRRRLPGHNRHH